MNKSIMYWKWDDSNLDQATLEEKINDLTARTEITYISIGTHWCKLSYDDPTRNYYMGECARLLHEKGRKVIFERCPRTEGLAFLKKYPTECCYLVKLCPIPLDKDGNGKIQIDFDPVYHYTAVFNQDGEHELLKTWAFKSVGDDTFLDGSLAEITSVSSSISAEEKKIIISVSGAPEKCDKAVVAVAFKQPIPDLASDKLPSFYEELMVFAKAAKLDGAMSDEWGYDVILHINTPNPYDDNTLSMEHLPYSQNFDRFFKERTGYGLLENFLFLEYAPEGNTDKRKKTINDFLHAYRALMAKNDEDMYDLTKKYLGKDSFFGVHPTWWGSVDKLNFEFYKNGFYWWQAKRDIAQTDETVIIPIRTALAHKFKSEYWYNMWYSMGTRDIKTYFTETYQNMLFGGKTHYLGYECPNESVVLAFKPQGLMEQIEEVDVNARMLDGVLSQPDSRVLVLFGFDAVGNWAEATTALPPWTPKNKRLDYVLNTTHELFNEYLCDLVPTDEIDNGSLKLNCGKPVYGNQEYDAVVFLYPVDLNDAENNFINALNVPLLCTDSAKVSEIVEFLKKSGIEKNRLINAAKMQDGSRIFVSDGKKPSGNDLNIDVDFYGKVKFKGEDFLYISPDGKKIISPKYSECKIG